MVVKLTEDYESTADITGAITGNILGALLGEQAIPPIWMNQLELADIIRDVGNDLYTTEGTEGFLKRYPPK